MPQGLIRPYQEKLSFIWRIFDLLVINLCLFISAELYDRWQPRYWAIGAVSMVIFLLSGEVYGLYRSFRRSTFWREAGEVFRCWSLVIPVVLFVNFVRKINEDYSRGILLIWFVSTPIIISVFHTLLRVTLRKLRGMGWNTRRVAVLGVTEMGFRISREILASPWMGLNFIGLFDDMEARDQLQVPWKELSLQGSVENLVEEAREGRVDVIYITIPVKEELRLRKIIDRFSDTTASIYVVPSFFQLDLLHARWTTVGEIPAISVFDSPFHGADGVVKRLEDLILGAAILLLISIPMLFIAICVKLTSKGPVFFRQRRYGLNGQEILIWKFRTMTVCEDGTRVIQAKKDDNRLTPIGGFLRKYSLDELPQFFNVIGGSMSIVGPRPHAISHNEHYREIIKGYMLRHQVLPGITGWAQVNGWRGETDTLEKMQKRVEYDMFYIREWSLIFDLRIIIQTVLGGFSGKNAY